MQQYGAQGAPQYGAPGASPYAGGAQGVPRYGGAAGMPGAPYGGGMPAYGMQQYGGYDGQYGWPVQQWGPPPPPPPRRGRGVLAASAVAATVALAALVASVVIVVATPQPEPAPTGENLAAYYDDRLSEPPGRVTINIADHPLYDAATPQDIACDVPELDSGSDDSWEEFATATGHCLDELWAPVFDDLGLSVDTPEITVTRESPDSGDEEGYTLAYYESELERITVVLPNVRTLGGQIPAQAHEDVWVALMGHEYGHHVQYVTGILDISHEMRRKSASEAEELDTLRRTELQAECMAGIGLRAITGADERSLRWVNENFNGGGDLPTHGTATNRAHWLEQGWNEATVGGCNTYGAASGEVT
ncbi:MULTISPECIES: neutral zinc metallopeptidase [unclassified Nocardiopsis]|uniref:neutral zinc metallopeptidase n=1 Tax=Nocardiopsis TaxID=2013 RepID=UPI00387ABF1E